MTLSVLVAGDDLAVQELIREVFVLHRVSVRAANDGQEAAKIASQEKFDGIFTDLEMPKLNGYELIRRIRQSSWNTHTPIVIIAEQGDSETRAEAFKAGGTFFLQKPINRLHIMRLLKSTRGTMAEERRLSKRIPHCTEVTSITETHTFVGMSSNLSINGILLQTDGSMKRGAAVRLSFRLEEEKPPIQARGVVIRVDKNHRVGVRFVPLLSDHVQRVHDYIAKRMDSL